ncbi:MAG: beta-lactamase hydrolase domain-containing protein [Halothece sp.]
MLAYYSLVIKQRKMDNTITLSPEFAIAGQLTPEQLQSAKEAGYQSVVNLRVSEEQGFIDNQEAAEKAGLQYVHIPVSPKDIQEISPVAEQVLAELDQLPKPVLVHCGSALRAGGMVLAYLGTRQGKTAEEVIAQGKQAGFTVIDSKPPLKQFIEECIKTHS